MTATARSEANSGQLETETISTHERQTGIYNSLGQPTKGGPATVKNWLESDNPSPLKKKSFHITKSRKSWTWIDYLARPTHQEQDKF